MGFKFKTNKSGNFEAQEEAYYDHLSKYDMKSHRDLWRYFYYDFFHDGVIEEIILKKGTSELIFKLNCPNIKRKGGNDFEYINVDFECIFKDVVYLNLDNNDSEYFQEGNLTFLYSEINTLNDLMKLKKKDLKEDFQSLVIELLGNQSSFFIEIIFEDIFVKAVENTAYQLMLSSDKFEVPMFKIKDS